MTTTAMCVMVWQHHHRSVVRWALIGQWVLESNGAVRRDRTASSQTPRSRHTRPHDDGTKDAARSPCVRAHRDGGAWRPRSTPVRAFAPFASLSRLAPTRQRLSRTFSRFTRTPPFLRTPVHGIDGATRDLSNPSKTCLPWSPGWPWSLVGAFEARSNRHQLVGPASCARALASTCCPRALP